MFLLLSYIDICSGGLCDMQCVLHDVDMVSGILTNLVRACRIPGQIQLMCHVCKIRLSVYQHSEEEQTDSSSLISEIIHGFRIKLTHWAWCCLFSPYTSGNSSSSLFMTTPVYDVLSERIQPRRVIITDCRYSCSFQRGGKGVVEIDN